MKSEPNRILIVEDNDNDLELTIEALKECQLAFEIDIVKDGAEVFDYLFCKGKWSARKRVYPSAILLDLKIPKINGLEVLKKIREDDTSRVIPVVILSSSNVEQDIIDAYTLGANAYVAKPVDFYKYLNAIKHIGSFWGSINSPPD